MRLRDFVFVDIRANIGAYSITVSSFSAKKIFSIEPDPLWNNLVENIEINNLQKIVFPLHVGLSDEPSTMRWHEDKANPGNAHLVFDSHDINFDKILTKFEDKFIECKVIELDSLVSEHSINQIDIVKIDVEGMEWPVIKGGKETIRKFMPIMIVETHRVASDMMGYDCITPLFNFFYELGYESFYLREDGSLCKFIYPNFKIDTFFLHPDKHNFPKLA